LREIFFQYFLRDNRGTKDARNGAVVYSTLLKELPKTASIILCPLKISTQITQIL
jgi:hypothetical protein